MVREGRLRQRVFCCMLLGTASRDMPSQTRGYTLLNAREHLMDTRVYAIAYEGFGWIGCSPRGGI